MRGNPDNPRMTKINLIQNQINLRNERNLADKQISRRSFMKKLIIDVLEKVDKKFMEKEYASIRNKEFAKKSGIYALYDKKGHLYYVGRASDLRGRLGQHLKHNRHSGKWNHFSIYFTKNDDTAIAVEAIALSLLRDSKWPKGNNNNPRVKEDKNMKARIRKDMDKIFFRKSSQPKKPSGRSAKIKLGRSKRQNKGFNVSQGGAQKRLPLKELFNKGFLQEPQILIQEYKRSGETFHAILLPSGEIEYQGKKYSSPSAPAKAATGKEQNGWDFWKIQNRSNIRITLNEFAKNPQKLNNLK